MLTTLELFILSLIKQGITTPYGWQARARVSLGASLPAMRRLLSGSMVKEADKGPRGRREFRITRAGRSELKKTDVYLERALDDDHFDLESILRLACIAISEGKPDVARRLLLQTAEEHAKRSRQAGRRTAEQPKQSSVAELYSAAMAHCDASRLEATSKSLASLTSAFGLDSK